jgi:hypothetical protein
MSNPHAPPRPHLALRVGVTGHRLNRLLEQKVDIDRVRKQVRAVLVEVQQAAEQVRRDFDAVYTGDPILYLISPLAEGADQIVADVAIELGYKLHVPLPSSAAIYTAGFQRPKHSDEDPVRSFDRLIRKAESVQVLDGDERAQLTGAAFAVVGRTVLRHSDILIALWDGTAAEGAGGTGDIVAQAREWSVPMVVIDPASPEKWQLEENAGESSGKTLGTLVREVLAPPPAGETESRTTNSIAQGLTGYLNTHIAWGFGGFFNSAVSLSAWDWPLRVGLFRLGRITVKRAHASWDAIWTEPTRLDPDIVHPLSHLLREYYAWADGLANRFGTLHRDLSTIPYLLSLVAVFWTLWVERVEPHVTSLLLQAVVALLVAAATVGLYLMAVLRRYHDRWIDYRSLAEELRQLAFLWPLGRPLRTPHLSGEAASEASRFAWVGWYARAVARQGGLYPGVLTPARLDTWRRILVERFLGPQREYHERTGNRFHRVQERLHTTAFVLFGAALVLAILDLIFILMGQDSLLHGDLHASPPWIALALALAVLLPSIASSVHAFLSQGDFSNLARRSTRMDKQLKDLIKKVDGVPPTIEGLGDAVEDASDVMRDEVLNWRVFVRLKPPALA